MTAPLLPPPEHAAEQIHVLIGRSGRRQAWEWDPKRKGWWYSLSFRAADDMPDWTYGWACPEPVEVVQEIADDWQRRADEAEQFMKAYLSAPDGDDPPVTIAGYRGPQIIRRLAALIGRLEEEAVFRALGSPTP